MYYYLCVCKWHWYKMLRLFKTSFGYLLHQFCLVFKVIFFILLLITEIYNCKCKQSKFDMRVFALLHTLKMFPLPKIHPGYQTYQRSCLWVLPAALEVQIPSIKPQQLKTEFLKSFLLKLFVLQCLGTTRQCSLMHLTFNIKQIMKQLQQNCIGDFLLLFSLAD